MSRERRGRFVGRLRKGGNNQAPDVHPDKVPKQYNWKFAAMERCVSRIAALTMMFRQDPEIVLSGFPECAIVYR
jgi:hypothetical protein